MKAFYVITVAFCLMIGGIVFNRSQVNGFVDDSTKALQAIGAESGIETTKDTAETILESLEKFKFSIPQKKVNAVRNYVEILKLSEGTENALYFETVRRLLTNPLKEIDEAERISFSNLF